MGSAALGSAFGVGRTRNHAASLASGSSCGKQLAKPSQQGQPSQP